MPRKTNVWMLAGLALAFVALVWVARRHHRACASRGWGAWGGGGNRWGNQWELYVDPAIAGGGIKITDANRPKLVSGPAMSPKQYRDAKNEWVRKQGIEPGETGKPMGSWTCDDNDVCCDDYTPGRCLPLEEVNRLEDEEDEATSDMYDDDYDMD